MDEVQKVFDRRAVRRHRDRAAKHLSDHDFLFREVGQRLVERLELVKRRFPVALDLGAHGGTLGALLGGRGGIETLVQCDLSPRMAARARAALPPAAPPLVVTGDEEWLPFGPRVFDLVLSCLSLQWVNDLPGALVQIRAALKPDGLFLGAVFGPDTLVELRRALIEAELAERGGAGARVSPFVEVREAGALLQRAGFSLPAVDADVVTVTYASALDLMRDLRGMSESNAIAGRQRHFTRRSTILRATAIYADSFADRSGRVPATFQIVTMTGWAPHASRPRPLKPGAAARRIAQALGTVERSAGEKAAPAKQPP
ncbi:MAG: methyltransferase domain-containing protein [Pseudomonadota bacterium]